MNYAFGLSIAPPRTAAPRVTQPMQTIDVHAPILTEETIRLMQREAPTIGPRLSDMGERFASLDVAGNVYRHFPRGGIAAVCRRVDSPMGRPAGASERLIANVSALRQVVT